MARKFSAWRRVCRRLLLAALSVLLLGSAVVGLPPATRANAATQVKLKIDPGFDVDRQDLVQILDRMRKKDPKLSDALRRVLDDFTTSESEGLVTDGWVDVEGTMSPDADGGVEIDVAPGSIPESPYSTFWRSFITGALGGGLAMNVRAACMKWIHARFSGDFLKGRAKSGCATAANAISA